MVKAGTGPGRLAGATFLPADADRLIRAAEAAGAGVWEWNLAQDVIYASARLSEFLGFPAQASEITATEFFERIHQDDLPLFRVALSEAVREDDPFIHEFRMKQTAGNAARWLSYRGQVLDRGEEGEPLVLAGLCLDVTDRRQTQEAYDLLNRELSHRMKNLLSVVSSLVNMTSEHRPEAKEFVSSFQTRLNTFAAAHELLMRADWQPVQLASLVEKALSPIGVRGRIDVSTDSKVTLGSNDAQTVVLVLHELATNAIKYGALSNGTGRVALSFEADHSSETGPLLVMHWKENGGPTVEAPDTRGFGIKLIERLTKRQRAGNTVLDWKPEGLQCCVEIPITPPRRRPTLHLSR